MNLSDISLPSLKQSLSGILMVTTLVGATALLKAGSAHAFPPQMAEALNLSAAQQTELEEIKEDARAQVEAVLTEEQQAAVAGTTGRDFKRAIRQLDLDEDQRTQLQAIREDSRAAMDEVLTEDQQAQFQELKAARQGRRKNHRGDFAAKLNLTPEQQSELDAIKEDARSQAEAVLTEEQQAELAGKTGREWMRAMRDLDLSEDQRTQLRAIREDSRAAADQVFTEDQRAQIAEMREQYGNRRR